MLVKGMQFIVLVVILIIYSSYFAPRILNLALMTHPATTVSTSRKRSIPNKDINHNNNVFDAAASSNARTKFAAGSAFADDESDDTNTDPDDDYKKIDYPPFIGADAVLGGLTSVDGQKLNGLKGKLTAYDVEKKRWSIALDGGGTKKIKVENIEVIPLAQTLDPETHTLIENVTSMSLAYGVDPSGNVLTGPISKISTERVAEMIDPNFIDYIEKLITTMQQTGHQFNFEAIEQDTKEAAKTHYCFGCSKRLQDDSKWSSTVNMNKKSGGFEKNTYHVKCLYDASFKV